MLYLEAIRDKGSQKKNKGRRYSHFQPSPPIFFKGGFNKVMNLTRCFFFLRSSHPKIAPSFPFGTLSPKTEILINTQQKKRRLSHCFSVSNGIFN